VFRYTTPIPNPDIKFPQRQRRISILPIRRSSSPRVRNAGRGLKIYQGPNSAPRRVMPPACVISSNPSDHHTATLANAKPPFCRTVEMDNRTPAVVLRTSSGHLWRPFALVTVRIRFSAWKSVLGNPSAAAQHPSFFTGHPWSSAPLSLRTPYPYSAAQLAQFLHG